MRSHTSFDRLKSARKSDDQLQRRSAIAIRGGCGLLSGFGHNN
jgi:hypothetical protein